MGSENELILTIVTPPPSPPPLTFAVPPQQDRNSILTSQKGNKTA